MTIRVGVRSLVIRPASCQAVSSQIPVGFASTLYDEWYIPSIYQVYTTNDIPCIYNVYIWRIYKVYTWNIHCISRWLDIISKLGSNKSRLIFYTPIIGYYLLLFAIIAIIAIIFLRKLLILLAIIAQGPKTLIIAINRILLLQFIFLATNYMHYWD